MVFSTDLFVFLSNQIIFTMDGDIMSLQIMD